jgi:hypothetical protein
LFCCCCIWVNTVTDTDDNTMQTLKTTSKQTIEQLVAGTPGTA